MSNNQGKQVVVISAEVDPSLKAAFKKWWKEHKFTSEAEAVRYFVRSITGMGPNCQENLSLN